MATTDGTTHLVYELEVTNVLPQDVTIDSVKAEADGKSLLTLSAADLINWTSMFGTAKPGTTMGPGESGRVWMDVSIAKGESVPTQVQNSLTVTLSTPMLPLLPATVVTPLPPMTVSGSAIKIAPPMQGAGWVDANGCCTVTPHRHAVNPIDGSFWVAERFAIDWVQVDAQGKLFNGDRAKLESYPYFGTDIQAVANGKVVAVLDGLPEQVPGASPTGLPLDEYAGNHVVQDLGNGHYALYAHLKTGSVKVEAGDELSAGQVLGNLGNSGNTDAPHLHFHVMAGPDPLRANGLPYEFDSFELTGRLASLGAVDELATTGGPAPMQSAVSTGTKTDELPMFLDVVTFPS
ncbi:M23 family metallopeptidase [Aldersonia kunmingensis]|uniref:M23 family metallopeptidase n=1 Tax=Aldersonia kunmingensis TaxID=408066 RepID=UPI001FDF0CDA|nr:M23 family metallopeptidase [Aldersonia kunmingensis]